MHKLFLFCVETKLGILPINGKESGILAKMVKLNYFRAHSRRTLVAATALVLGWRSAPWVAFAPPFGKAGQNFLPVPFSHRKGTDSNRPEHLNPPAVNKDGQFVMLYRAQDHQGTSYRWDAPPAKTAFISNAGQGPR